MREPDPDPWHRGMIGLALVMLAGAVMLTAIILISRGAMSP